MCVYIYILYVYTYTYIYIYTYNIYIYIYVYSFFCLQDFITLLLLLLLLLCTEVLQVLHYYYYYYHYYTPLLLLYLHRSYSIYANGSISISTGSTCPVSKLLTVSLFAFISMLVICSTESLVGFG